MLNKFGCRGIVIEKESNHFLGTSNGNMNYNFIDLKKTRNVSFKHHVVKMIFSSLGISFKPVVVNIKTLFKCVEWPSNLDIVSFLLLLFKSCVCFFNNCPFNFKFLRKQPIFKTNLLNWFFDIKRSKMIHIELLLAF